MAIHHLNLGGILSSLLVHFQTRNYPDNTQVPKISNGAEARIPGSIGSKGAEAGIPGSIRSKGAEAGIPGV